jgi:ribonuclease P protein component
MKDNRSYPKEDRIRSRKEFQELYKTGRKFSTQYYLIFYQNVPATEKSPGKGMRLGISIPGRLGNAVFRNYQKRVLREYFRKEMKHVPVSVAMLFVLRKKPESREALIVDLGKVTAWLKKSETRSAK